MDITTKSVIRHVVRFYSEDQYMTGLHAIHRKIADPAVFWEAFWEVWSLSERHFLDRDITAEMMTPQRLASPHRTLSLEPDEQAVLADLPDRIRVFRGCWADNVEGWSWTLSVDVARKFATWMPVDGQPLIVEGKVAKGEILAYLGGREEQEIVVDPRHVIQRRIRKLPKKRITLMDRIALLARTGMLDTAEQADAKKEHILFSDIQHQGIDAFKTLCDQMIAEATFWENAAKVTEWRDLREQAIAFAERRLDTPMARSFYDEAITGQP
jgi:hypothetical protein